MPVAAVDFETYYCKRDGVSIITQGTWHYLHDPQFDAYLVSIAADTGLRWVGHPKDAPWDQISGPEWTWAMHNASFDQPVFEMLRDEKGIVPKHVGPREYQCTADMVAYLGYPRSLADACELLLGLTLDKAPRGKMDGKLWKDVGDEQQAEMLRYALKDAENCLVLWQKYSSEWPEWERRVSQVTRLQVARGIRIDVERVERDIQRMQRLVWEADKKIPWSKEAPALSYPMLVAECRKVGVVPPKSLDMKDEACAAWEEQHGDEFPWIDAMRTKRRSNALLKKLQTLRKMVRADGRASLPLKYCGASTRRWSGGYSEKSDLSLNPQNLPSKPMLWDDLIAYGVVEVPDKFPAAEASAYDFNPKHLPDGFDRDQIDQNEFLGNLFGVDLRKCLIASPGKKLVTCDLSQIEPRVLFLLAGDEDALAPVRAGMEIYEAHARQALGYTLPIPLKTAGETDPKYKTLRKCSKAQVIGLGYQCAAEKYITVAKTMADYDVSLEQALKEVRDYRRQKRKVVGLWGKLQSALMRTAGDGDLVLEMPSGNKLIYRHVLLEKKEIRDPKTKKKIQKTGYAASVCKNTHGKEKMCRVIYYGGKLAENLTQATARDLFATALLRLEDNGHPLVLNTHDEATVEVDESVDDREIERLMCVPPDWLPNIPLNAEADSAPYYCK